MFITTVFGHWSWQTPVDGAKRKLSFTSMPARAMDNQQVDGVIASELGRGSVIELSVVLGLRSLCDLLSHSSRTLWGTYRLRYLIPRVTTSTSSICPRTGMKFGIIWIGLQT